MFSLGDILLKDMIQFSYTIETNYFCESDDTKQVQKQIKKLF